jgi:hypothetical protein
MSATRIPITNDRMAKSLRPVKEEIWQALDLSTLGGIAGKADDVMVSENRDWLGVMRYHDFELHV